MGSLRTNSGLSSWVSVPCNYENRRRVVVEGRQKKRSLFFPQSQRAKIEYVIFRAGQQWIRNPLQNNSSMNYRSDGALFPLANLVWIS